MNRKDERAFIRELKSLRPDPGTGILKIPRYDRDSWKRCYPSSDSMDYEVLQQPDSFLGFLSAVMADDGLERERGSGLRIAGVQVDWRFFRWLGRGRNVPIARVIYSEEYDLALSEPCAYSDSTTYPCAVVFRGAKGDPGNDSTLPETAVNSLKEELAALCGEPSMSVYVSRYLMPPAACLGNYSALREAADISMRSGQNVRYEHFTKMPDCGDGATDLLCLFASFRKWHPKQGVNPEEVLGYRPMDCMMRLDAGLPEPWNADDGTGSAWLMDMGRLRMAADGDTGVFDRQTDGLFAR